ncbi:MAG: extracellular solute-binding protein, partial [Bacillota bacterium]
MKKSIRLTKRATAVLMAFIIMAGILSACGSKKGNQQLSEFVYVPQYTAAPKEVTDISSPFLSGDVIYFSAYVPVRPDGTVATQAEIDEMYAQWDKYYAATEGKVPAARATGTDVAVEEPAPEDTADEAAGDTTLPVEPPVMDFTYKTFLYAMNKDGTNYHQLPDYMPPDAGSDPYTYSNLDRMVVDAEGNIWVAESVSKTIFNLPEGFDETKQSPWEYYVKDERQTIIKRLSETGATLSSIDLSQFVETSEEQDMYGGFYLNNMITDKSGKLYISDGNQNVYVIGTDGAFMFKLKVDNWVSSLICLRDGSVGVVTNAPAATADGSYGMVLKLIDTATKNWGKELPVPNNVWNTSDGGDKYDFCYTDNSSLFGYDTATETSEKILTWLNCDVDGDTVRFSTVQADGNVFALAQDYSDSGEASFDIITLVKTPRSEVKQKTTLRLATMWLDYNLKKQLLKFNKTNPDYRIEISDYSEFNTGEDFNAGATKLNTEIISGNIPDMIDISNLPFKQYAAKGLLEDLYPFIDADAEIKKDSFVPGIMKALETDGKLYQIATSFGVLSVIGSPSVVGTEMGWTMADMQRIIAEHPEADYPFGMYMDRASIMRMFCMLNMDQYMDWQTGECSFNSDEFKNLLAFAKSFPAEIDYNDEEGKGVSMETLIQDGRQLFTFMSVSDFRDFQWNKAMFGGAITFKGFPSASGGGNIAQVSGGLAVTTSCKDKDGAWQFIRSLLTEEYQDNLSWNYPILQASYDKKLA